MKKIFYIIILFAAGLISACEKESSRTFEETQVEIKESNVVFTAAGGVGSIVVADDEKSVSVTSNESWCQVNVSGSTITVNVTPNLSMDGRTALVTLKSGEKVNYVPVSQEPVYLHLDNYNGITFLGKGGVISFPYICDVEIPITVISEASWLSGNASEGNINLTASLNTDFLNGRSATIKIVAGDNLASVWLDVIQGELITSYEVDPEANTIDDFLNLKNGGTYSGYKVVFLSSRLATLYNNLKEAYPILQEIRIQAPRSSYKTTVILYNLDGETASYYYWNATNGLIQVGDSKSVGVFAFSGNTYSGSTAPYTSNTNYTQLREVFASEAGFTIFPDFETDGYWFRSVANPMDYFRVEPFSW